MTTSGADGPRRRRTLPVLLGVLVVLLLITGSAIAGAVIFGDDDPAPAATGQDPVANQSTPSATPSPEQTTAVESTPVVEPSTTAPEIPAAQCWDGSAATKVANCSEPTGAQGLRWVFPSVERADCGPNGPNPNRSQLWSCIDYLPDGTEIEFNYSQWRTVPAAVAHYDADAYDKTAWSDGRTRWLIIADAHEDSYKAALMYVGKPWSVTIYAPTSTARDRATDHLVQMRPRAELRGTR